MLKLIVITVFVTNNREWFICWLAVSDGNSWLTALSWFVLFMVSLTTLPVSQSKLTKYLVAGWFNELWVRKNVSGNSCDVIGGNILEFAWWDERNYENPAPGYLVTGPRFDSNASGIWVRYVNRFIQMLGVYFIRERVITKLCRLP
jgi:hypothetical protein